MPKLRRTLKIAVVTLSCLSDSQTATDFCDFFLIIFCILFVCFKQSLIRVYRYAYVYMCEQLRTVEKAVFSGEFLLTSSKSDMPSLKGDICAQLFSYSYVLSFKIRAFFNLRAFFNARILNDINNLVWLFYPLVICGNSHHINIFAEVFVLTFLSSYTCSWIF